MSNAKFHFVRAFFIAPWIVATIWVPLLILEGLVGPEWPDVPVAYSLLVVVNYVITTTLALYVLVLCRLERLTSLAVVIAGTGIGMLVLTTLTFGFIALYGGLHGLHFSVPILIVAIFQAVSGAAMGAAIGASFALLAGVCMDGRTSDMLLVFGLVLLGIYIISLFYPTLIQGDCYVFDVRVSRCPK